MLRCGCSAFQLLVSPLHVIRWLMRQRLMRGAFFDFELFIRGQVAARPVG